MKSFRYFQIGLQQHIFFRYTLKHENEKKTNSQWVYLFKKVFPVEIKDKFCNQMLLEYQTISLNPKNELMLGNRK